MSVAAHENPSYGANPGNATQDKVILLSITEAERYFGSASGRKCVPTAYAKAQGVYTNSSYGGTCWWWLRSPGYNQDFAACVCNDGDVYEHGYYVGNDGHGVRPALWIDLES